MVRNYKKKESYVAGLVITGQIDLFAVFEAENNWMFVVFGTLCLSTLILARNIQMWCTNNWEDHPIAKSLSIYQNQNNTWRHVAADINEEFKMSKLIIQTNYLTKVIVTRNWLIKVTPYFLCFSHQSNIQLKVDKSDSHPISAEGVGLVQYVGVEVKNSRRGGENFNFRMKAMEFMSFQDAVRRPITIVDNVVFYRTVAERFVDSFQEVVANNKVIETDEEQEVCIGCMQVEANVKLNKLCIDDTSENAVHCGNCYCRPMMCVTCLAKWFATKQDTSKPETWMHSTGECISCRSKFCMLDISYIKKIEKKREGTAAGTSDKTAAETSAEIPAETPAGTSEETREESS